MKQNSNKRFLFNADLLYHYGGIAGLSFFCGGTKGGSLLLRVRCSQYLPHRDLLSSAAKWPSWRIVFARQLLFSLLLPSGQQAAHQQCSGYVSAYTAVASETLVLGAARWYRTGTAIPLGYNSALARRS